MSLRDYLSVQNYYLIDYKVAIFHSTTVIICSSMEAYWSNFDNPRPRPIDTVVDKVPPVQMAHFMKGAQALSLLVERDQPDAIFVPERGAGPIVWAVDSFLKAKGIEYPKIYLPVGTNTDPLTARQEGFNATTKRRMISTEIERFRELSGKEIKSATLIDEVQSGATISTASRYVAELLPDSRLHVIAVQDNRTNILHRNKTHAFSKLASNERVGIQASVVPIPLFTVDRSGLMDTIFRPSDAPESQQPDMLMIMRNTEAEAMMKTLALASLRPDLLLKCAQEIKDGGTSTIDLSEKDQEVYRQLYTWVESLTKDDSVPKPEARRKRILFWLNSFANHANTSNTD